jgi:hypothetical protein
VYSTADLRFVLNQLDLDFEHKIGYITITSKKCLARKKAMPTNLRTCSIKLETNERVGL